MTAKSYIQLFKQSGVAGNTELAVRVFDVSSGDTVQFSGDLTRLDRAAYIGRSGQVPDIATIASTAFSSKTILTFPTSPSFLADDVDLMLLGPAAAS